MGGEKGNTVAYSGVRRLERKIKFRRSSFVLSVLPAWLVSAVIGPVEAEVRFDPAMISGAPLAVADLSLLTGSQSQLPGEYLVDIYINGFSKSSRVVRFFPMQQAIAVGNRRPKSVVRDNTGLEACLEVRTLKDMGVNISASPELFSLPDEQCISPGTFIPGSWTALDFQRMRLDISVPQAAMLSRARGWIPVERWDEGIDAALLSWQMSGNDSRGKFGNSRGLYLNLTNGLNLGAWRLRDNSIWSQYESDYSRSQSWQHLNTYAKRAIIPWHSEIILGDATTEGNVFDGLSFRGITLATDDSMLPDTMRGFAPVIRGVANGSAQISVRQSGNVIYQAYVPAGPFVINDLYPLSSGGDLEVIVTEADGAARAFTVPYSSVPVLQREGRLKYGFTAGRYRNTSDRYDAPMFFQGTVMRGLEHSITVYGGTQLASAYQSALLGVGANLGRWGAVSADVTQADSTLADHSRHQGQSFRFLYGRSLIATGTTFQLAGYRYSTKGFYTLDETALKDMSGFATSTQASVDAAGRPLERWLDDYYDLNRSKRAQLQVNVSQRLGSVASLYLTGSRETYWNDSAGKTSVQAGFSGPIGSGSYTLSWAYTRQHGEPSASKTLWLSISMPLDGWLSGSRSSASRSMWANYNVGRDADGHVSHQAGISGTALEQGTLNWSASPGYSQKDGASGDVFAGYHGTYGTVSAGYGYADNYQQTRYGASGSAVLHRDGLTMGQQLGATNILIAAPGAAGLSVEGRTGVRTDWRGYAVMPYASQYRENRVALDVSQLDEHTDIEHAVTRVVPTQGALVRAAFSARTGVRAILTVMRDGKPLPFGATVSARDGSSSGLVGDGGQVYLAGLALQGELTAQWGGQTDQQCSISYRLPANALEIALVNVAEICN